MLRSRCSAEEKDCFCSKLHTLCCELTPRFRIFKPHVNEQFMTVLHVSSFLFKNIQIQKLLATTNATALKESNAIRVVMLAG